MIVMRKSAVFGVVRKKKIRITFKPWPWDKLITVLRKNGGIMKIGDIKLSKPSEMPIIDMGAKGFLSFHDYNYEQVLLGVGFLIALNRVSYNARKKTVRLLKRKGDL